MTNQRCKDIRLELTGYLPDLPENSPFSNTIRSHFETCESCRKWIRKHREWMHEYQLCQFIDREHGNLEYESEWTEPRKERLTQAIISQNLTPGKDQISSPDSVSISKNIKPLLTYLTAAAATILVLLFGYQHITTENGLFEYSPSSESAIEQQPFTDEIVDMEQFLAKSEHFLLLINELEKHWEETDSISFDKHAFYADNLRQHISELMNSYPVDEYPLTYDLFLTLDDLYAEASQLDSNLTKGEAARLIRISEDFALLTRVRLLRGRFSDQITHHLNAEVS